MRENFMHNRKSKPGSAVGMGGVRFIKPLKQVRQMLFWDVPRVHNGDDCAHVVARLLHVKNNFAIVRSKFDRVVDQRDEHLLNPVAVGMHEQRFLAVPAFQHANAAIRCDQAGLLHHFIDDAIEMEVAFFERNRAGLQAGKLQKIVDQSAEPHRLP